MFCTWLLLTSSVFALDLSYRDLQILDRGASESEGQPEWVEDRVLRFQTPEGPEWVSGRSVFETLLALEVNDEDLKAPAHSLYELERAVRLRIQERCSHYSDDQLRAKVQRAVAVLGISRALDGVVKEQNLEEQVGMLPTVPPDRTHYAVLQLISSGLIHKGILPVGSGLSSEHTLSDWYRLFWREFGAEPIELGVDWGAPIPGTEGLRESISRELHGMFFDETVLAFESLPQVDVEAVARLWVEELGHWDLLTLPNARSFERRIEELQEPVRIATHSEVDRLFFEGDSDSLRLLALELARFSQEEWNVRFEEFQGGLLGWMSRMERRFRELPFVLFRTRVEEQLDKRRASRSVPYLRQLALRSWVGRSEGLLQRRLQTAVSVSEMERRRRLPRETIKQEHYRMQGMLYRLSGVESVDTLTHQIAERVNLWNRRWRANPRLHSRSRLERDRQRAGVELLESLQGHVDFSQTFESQGEWSSAQAPEVMMRWLLEQGPMDGDKAKQWATETFLALSQREPFRVITGHFDKDAEGTLWVAVLHEAHSLGEVEQIENPWTDHELQAQIRSKTRDLVLRQSLEDLLRSVRLHVLRGLSFSETAQDWTAHRLIEAFAPLHWWNGARHSLDQVSQWSWVRSVDLSLVDAAFTVDLGEGLSFRERTLREWMERADRDLLCARAGTSQIVDFAQCIP